jgi:serine/threonine-protein kinase RsbW
VQQRLRIVRKEKENEIIEDRYQLWFKQLEWHSIFTGLIIIQRRYPQQDSSVIVNFRGFNQLTALKTIHFQVNSDLKALDQVLFHFDQIHQSWIPKKDWLQCQLALAEGFTNAVRHAHKGLSSEIPIEIEVSISQHSLEIRIWDYGLPFDLLGFLQTLDQQSPQLSDHGQGLPILQKISTHLSYLRTDDNRNCLLIIKQFSR